MKEESLEDILEQSRRMTTRKRFERINKKLWIAIGITSLIVIIGWPIIVPMPTMGTSEKVSFAFMAEIISFPILAGILALPMALLPIMGWKYPEKFYRVFLIILLVFNTFMALVCLIALAFKVFSDF